MCGIFSIFNYNGNTIELENEFKKGVNRGPEFSTLQSYKMKSGNNLHFGFHRLAINGLDEISNQPFKLGDITLICNGEIYNYKQLAIDNNIVTTSNSDCEIIAHLYRLYGIEYTCTLLDGVFAFVLYDAKTNDLYAVRDPYGVRPLYYLDDKSNNTLAFASELKVLYNLTKDKSNIHNFIPGYYMTVSSNYDYDRYNFSRYCNAYNYFPTICNPYYDNISSDIYSYISGAVRKRVIGTTERPIACLLSGGLDSSLVAALVASFYPVDKKLQTYSIGLPGSEDLKYAAIVAKHIKSDHHEIVVTEDEFFDAIPEVIKAIESYDTTTVRASVGNYLLGKYIKANSDAKVIFNGDGADELMGGYLYFKNAPSSYEFDKECKRLLQDIYMFDVLRSDRSISSHGLEPRTPFLDRQFVEFYLSIDKNLRFTTTINNCEKYLIRKSVDKCNKDLLPKEILWRTKEAFSDGVSSLNKSWFQIIQEKIQNKFYITANKEDKPLKDELCKIMKDYDLFDISDNKPTTFEQAYYRHIYNTHYKGTDHLIEYFWMPRYVKASDSSARTLELYNKNNSNNKDKELSNNLELE